MHGAKVIQISKAPSCVAWAKDRKEAQSRELLDQAWLLGYLSGIAVVRNKNFLQGTDSDSIFRRIDNYCRENPLKDINDAADDLAKELIQQKGL